jgi:hypothetical protein
VTWRAVGSAPSPLSAQVGVALGGSKRNNHPGNASQSRWRVSHSDFT